MEYSIIGEIDKSDSDVNAVLGACSCARVHMVHSIKEPLGTNYRVVEILFGPEHLVVVKIASIEQIEADMLEAAIPTFRISVRPSTRMIRQQSIPKRIAVMVESDDAVGHEDMVSRKAFARDDTIQGGVLPANTPARMAHAPFPKKMRSGRAQRRTGSFFMPGFNVYKVDAPPQANR
ncbi:hypothetical protein [Sinorhizobium sojae]|uniref:hypothetical protein n=1 Tax=Sinorhizobium sojae TaxID=716925 RepID=UPI0012FC6BFA|nr:hypothetical protein [Sinorhizobium sojae]